MTQEIEEVAEPVEIKSPEVIQSPSKKPPQSYPDFIPDRYKYAHNLLKRDMHERSIIEESFRLNNNYKDYSAVPSPVKLRNANSPLLPKLEKVNLVDTELFAGIRDFWNSGPNKDLTAEEKKQLMFKIDDVDFFKINVGNSLQELLKADNETPKRNTKAVMSLTTLDIIKHKEKAVVANLGSENQIVQPNYMKNSGTMCFTELWSNKQRSGYMKTMKKEMKIVNVKDAENMQYESVYRPEKIKTQKLVNKKLMQLKNTFGPGPDQVIHPEFKRYSLSVRNNTLGSLSSTPREAYAQKGVNNQPTTYRDYFTSKDSPKVGKDLLQLAEQIKKGQFNGNSFKPEEGTLPSISQKTYNSPESSNIKKIIGKRQKHRSLISLDMSPGGSGQPQIKSQLIRKINAKGSTLVDLGTSPKNEASPSEMNTAKTLPATEIDLTQNKSPYGSSSKIIVKSLNQLTDGSPKVENLGFT